MATRLNIRDRCKVRFRDPNNDIYTDDEWDDYIADAESDVHAASPHWPFLDARTTSTVTSTGEVTLPTDAWRVSAVYNDTDNYPLVPIEGRADYRYAFPDPDQNLGSPTHYRLRSNVLEVYPRPASSVTLSLDYAVAPAVMTDDAHEPDFPEQYHKMLVSGALAYAYEDDGNSNMATVHRAKFEHMLDQMKDDLLVTRTERYTGIVDDFGF